MARLNSVGIDISDRTIEVVKMGSAPKSGAILIDRGSSVIPAGAIEHGRVKNRATLATAVKKALVGAKPSPIKANSAVFGLPESQVYTHFATIGNTMDHSLADLLWNEARTHIPIDEIDLLIGYHHLVDNEYLIIGTSRTLLAEWRDFFLFLGIKITFDTGSLAIFRSLYPEGNISSPIALLDLGSTTSTLAIFDSAGLRYSRLISVASDTLTTALVSELELTADEAEAEKRRVGLSDPENKIFNPLLKAIEPLKDEVLKTINFYQTSQNVTVGAVALVGGGSFLPGLAEYFSTNLERPTALGRSAWGQEGESVIYLGAIGLALRGLGRPWSEGAIRLEPDLPHGVLPPRPAERFIKWLKENRALSVLVAILIIGSVMIAWAFNSRSASEEKEQASRRAALEAIPVSNLSPTITNQVQTGTTTVSIKITDTPTGWLNVRSEPSTASSVLLKVYPGEVYPLLEEKSGWYRINLGLPAEAGWISSQYATSTSN